MKIIVLHDKYSNEPIVIRPDAIIAVRTIKDEEQEYSEIVMVAYTFIVKETIGDIINKIKKVESEINDVNLLNGGKQADNEIKL